jgi:hypothetical protein
MSGAQDHTGRFFCLERFPCHEMHINTTGHRASTPESRILASEPKDRYRAIWKTRERLKSTRRRPCDCQSPPARYYSSRPDRNQSWALLSRFQAVRRARFGRPAADRLHRSYRPSALSYLSNYQPLHQALRRARAQRLVNATDRSLSISRAVEPEASLPSS